MNKEKLDLVIDDYLEKFDYTHDADNEEFMKWKATAVFQKNWNIDAENFGEMFKKATSETSVFIDGKAVMPTQGIYHICVEHGQGEAVREAFRKLYAEDGRATQIHMDEFIDTVNKIVDTYYPHSWKYLQDRKAVSDYLGMLRPERDYFYKATSVENIARFTEFGADIGSGKNFHLKNYYKMCDEIIAAIKSREDLLEKERAELKVYADQNHMLVIETVDPEYHILAFDIIYCASAYGFFEKHPLPIPKPDDRKTKLREELEKKISEKEEPLGALYSERESLNYPSLVGKLLHHITYGNGIVTNQNEDNILVDFSGTRKKMKAGVLYSRKLIDDTEDDPTAKTVLTIVDLDQKIAQVELELLALKVQLESL